MDRYFYTGDIDMECGGVFMELPDDLEIKRDYCEVLNVIDLSCAGYDDVVMLESGCVYIPYGDMKKMNSALDVVGAKFIESDNSDSDIWPDIESNGEIIRAGTQDHWRTIVDALMAYGGVDNDYSTLVAICDDVTPRDNWEIDVILTDKTTEDIDAEIAELVAQGEESDLLIHLPKYDRPELINQSLQEYVSDRYGLEQE